MAKHNPFQRIQLVYRRSSLLVKILILVTVLVSAAALLALRGVMLGYQQQRQALQAQALQLQQENAQLTEYIAELGTEASVRRIAIEELGLADPFSKFFNPGE